MELKKWICLGVVFLASCKTPDKPKDPPIDPTPIPASEIALWRGEVAYLDKKPDTDLPTTAWNLAPVTTTRASYAGARIGEYKDAVMSCGLLGTCDLWRVSVPRDQAPGLYGDIRVLDKTMPARLPPFYAEVTSQKVFDAWRRATGSGDWSKQGPVTRQYLDFVRAHGVEPIKQSMSHYTGIDNYADYSYRKLVFEGAIAPPMMWVGEYGAHPPASWVQAVEAAAPAEAIFAGPDEAGTAGMSISDALARVRYIRQYSQRPIMMTGLPRSEFDGLNVLWCPNHVFRQAGTPKWGCTYGSCMSQGNCADTETPNPRRAGNFPLLLVDGNEAAQYVAFSFDAAPMGYYYSATVRLTSAWEPGGQYSEGGNGDGTLLYYDPSDGSPIASIRLVEIHKALQKLAKGS